ncbi:peptide ABC transporter permease [Thalassotalea sp. 42_200_T64]|nr:peptide ABC transporter permease [Thalassotalea sp. 42_200_T64]
MAKLVAIDHNVHKNLRINPAKAELHGAELNLIPAVVAEFTNLAVQYPIVLTKNGDTGEFVCTAMFGFEADENLFWQNGQWRGVYLPLQIQRQPFFIGDSVDDTSKNSGDFVVCIDVESPTIAKVTAASQSEYQTLFTEAGEDSQYFQHAKQCLGQLLQGEIDNNKLITALKELDLLQPLSLEITFVNEQSTRLNGLYSINQEKLAALSNEQIVMLHQKNLLQPIYTMITSLGQIYALIERKNASLVG